MPIDFATLTFEDLGRKVLYHPGYGSPEEGVITSWNPYGDEALVFVRYGRGIDSKATYARDLDWLVPNPDPVTTDELVDF